MYLIKMLRSRIIGVDVRSAGSGKKGFDFFYLYIGFIGIVGFLLMLRITPFGAGVNPDSTVYIGGAKSILSGMGFSSDGGPITRFPPLYSLFLAATSLFDGDFVQAARVLNALFFGLNAVLLAFAVSLAAGRNLLATTGAGFFFITSEPFLQLHAWASSEPLFIALFLGCIILISMYVIRPTLSLLIASSLCMGLALVTRYVGIALLPAALVIVFIGASGQHLSRRFRDTLIWLALACAPLLILLVRNAATGGSATSRIFVFHPMSLSHYINDIINVMLVYFAPLFLPPQVRRVIFGLLTVVFLALLVVLFKRRSQEVHWRSMGIVLPISCFGFALSYLLFLFVSLNFLDASTPTDARILSPILAILVIGLFSAMWALSTMLNMRVVWWSFILFIGLSLARARVL